MDIEDIKNIITEISNLRNQGFVLSEILDSDKILYKFDQINIQLKHGRYVLPKMYSLIKKNPKSS